MNGPEKEQLNEFLPQLELLANAVKAHVYASKERLKATERLNEALHPDVVLKLITMIRELQTSLEDKKHELLVDYLKKLKIS